MSEIDAYTWSLAVTLDQLDITPFAGANRRELSPQVAHGTVGEADIRLDNIDDFLVHHARALIFDDRQLEPFRINIGGNAVQCAADIRPVRHAAGKSDQFVIQEYRLGKRQMVQVTSGDVGVVGQQDVTRMDVLDAVMFELRLDGLRHAPDEHRQSKPDRDRFALWCEQPDREVECFIDDHVVGGAHQVGFHFLCDGNHAVADNLGDDGVGFHG